MFGRRKLTAGGMLILSGSSVVRYPSILNHTVYANRHGYRYRFDAVPAAGIDSLYKHKLAIILRNLTDCEWLFWIDDDAFFRQLSVPLQTVSRSNLAHHDLIFCRSPINNGAWTHLSAGNFFIRNCPRSRELLAEAIRTPISSAKAWWDAQRYGMFTNGDQDILIYLIERDSDLKSRSVILPFACFNSRPFHFERDEDHFLVHFTHRADMDKRQQMREFAAKHGLGPALLTAEDAGDYRLYDEQML